MLRTDRVFAAILVLSVVALVLFVGVALLTRWLTPWKRLKPK
jgi:ABC-type nitrate/sulfonate/bicarbonate transport system permease component